MHSGRLDFGVNMDSASTVTKGRVVCNGALLCVARKVGNLWGCASKCVSLHRETESMAFKQEKAR